MSLAETATSDAVDLGIETPCPPAEPRGKLDEDDTGAAGDQQPAEVPFPWGFRNPPNRSWQSRARDRPRLQDVTATHEVPV